MKKHMIGLITIMIAGFVIGLYLVHRRRRIAIKERVQKVMSFLRNPEIHQDLILPALSRFRGAPFLLPSTGFIGFLWGDSFKQGRRHQGIDIFSGTDVGVTPVYAAYDGYLTRLSGWKSSVIIRIPSDPIQTGRQIWTYYTHMAYETGRSLIVNAFPQGIYDKFVSAGTLLGYQGNYSGIPNRPTGVHLHFSIVRDDGIGGFLNELEIGNTLDPSPYFGLVLNGQGYRDQNSICSP